MFILRIPLIELAFYQTSSRFSFKMSRLAAWTETKLSSSFSLPNLLPPENNWFVGIPALSKTMPGSYSAINSSWKSCWVPLIVLSKAISFDANFGELLSSGTWFPKRFGVRLDCLRPAFIGESHTLTLTLATSEPPVYAERGLKSLLILLWRVRLCLFTWSA